MKELKEFEEKYIAQKEVINSMFFEHLDTKTLRACLRAFLVNTSNECIKIQIGLDTQQQLINPLSKKEKRSHLENLKLKNEKNNLQVMIEYKGIIDGALCDLLDVLMLNDVFKFVLAEDIPELFDSLYSFVDLEEYVISSIIDKISENRKKLNFSDVCKIINEGISETTNNAELIKDDIKNYNLYSEFVNLREKKKMKL